MKPYQIILTVALVLGVAFMPFAGFHYLVEYTSKSLIREMEEYMRKQVVAKVVVGDRDYFVCLSCGPIKPEAYHALYDNGWDNRLIDMAVWNGVVK